MQDESQPMFGETAAVSCGAGLAQSGEAEQPVSQIS